MLTLCRYFPFGIVFLIAGKILEMEDPSVIGQKLGLYAITVVSGLVIHGLILLPLLFVLITRKNPYAFIQGILQALLIALATSSRYEHTAETPDTTKVAPGLVVGDAAVSARRAVGEHGSCRQRQILLQHHLK